MNNFEITLYYRHDGVSSFIASDYDQVDFNVSRHLSFELKQTDWNLMILHYLGLDHVGKIYMRKLNLNSNYNESHLLGHIEGPYAPVSIKRKLH